MKYHIDIKPQSVIMSIRKITNIDNLRLYNFDCTSIISWCINERSTTLCTSYEQILDFVYIMIDDGSKIIKYSSLKTSTLERDDDEYRYYEYLGISVCHDITNGEYVYEIVNQCVKNELHINMNIKLNNGVFVELVF